VEPFCPFRVHISIRFLVFGFEDTDNVTGPVATEVGT
jgi:hypothetical protein